MPQGQPPVADTPHLVLVGNGDTHLHVAANAERFTRCGLNVTLLTRRDFVYADWLGGMLGGEWQRDEICLPAARIAAHGGDHFVAMPTAVDRRMRQLTLDDGRTLTYDWLSIDLPPELDEGSLPGCVSAGDLFGPGVDDLWRLRQQLETRLADASATLPRLAVVGGGPVGVELAANLLALGERYGRPLTVSLIGNDRQPLPGAGRRANRWLMQRLDRRGLQLELVARASRYASGQLILDDGSLVEADWLLITDRSRPSMAERCLALETDEHGEIAVDARLRSHEDPRLILPGQAAAKQALSPRARAAILIDSILQSRERRGEPSSPPRSHPHWRALNLGDLRDIAWRGSWWCRGRWVRRLKHRRDRREVAHYLQY
ncbi:FAD-dependent oxidoreductase [Salinicola avicenniae]|uniref:FAD-dependent oxidoreductase n=1 Tax=Salinicola avicenniae TaxID=2916836 RepID=UPI002073694A|nr:MULTISPECIES: FAD-dependent oxidoreductase [unclassified Salinicola]